MLLQLLLLPVRCTGQTISVVSRSTGADGAIGADASGESVSGAVRSPVTDTGDVFLLSLARLGGDKDDNYVRDVYRRSGPTTSVVSVSEFPPDGTVHGNAALVAVSQDGSRALTVRPLTDIDPVDRAFFWDLSGTPFTRTDISGGSIDTVTAALSGNGLFAVLSTGTDGVVTGDDNGKRDVLLYSATGTFSLLSVAHDGAAADGDSDWPSISADGIRTTFLSTATNLLPAGTDGAASVFLRNVGTGTTTRLNNRLDGTAPGPAERPVISADGNWVTFASSDAGLVGNDTNEKCDVFVVQSDATAMERVSVGSEGRQADGDSRDPVISQDGRFVAFVSVASNLTSVDTANKQQVYLHDRESGRTVLLSSSAGGAAANADCFAPAISPSGRYVTFASTASNLVAESFMSGVTQVFLVDRGEGYLNHPPDAFSTAASTPANSAVTLSLDGGDDDGDDLSYVISSLPLNGKLYDGAGQEPANEIASSGHVVADSAHQVTYVPNAAFTGFDGFGFTVRDAFAESAPAAATVTVGDIDKGVIMRVSRPSLSTEANNDSAGFPSMRRVGITADGTGVCYASLASNLDAGFQDANFAADVFAWSRDQSANTLVSVSTGGGQGGQYEDSYDCAISPSGRYVVFSSLARLADEDQNDYRDIYIRDLVTGTTTLVSRSMIHGLAGNGDSRSPSVSDGGEVVAFSSKATDLTSAQPAAEQVYVWDRNSNAVILISQVAGNPANADGVRPVVSSTGNAVAFESAATNLGFNTGGRANVFLCWLADGGLDLVSSPPGRQAADGDSGGAAVSMSGRYVAFHSAATNLVSGDTNGVSDVFVRDMGARSIERISLSADGVQADGACFFAAISASGRFVYFRSRASNLVGLDTAGKMSGYLVDRAAPMGGDKRIRLVSHAASGNASGNADTWNGAVSATGRYVAFASDATNLTASDTNGFRDVFLADFGEPANNPPVVAPGDVTIKSGETVTVPLLADDPEGDDVRFEVVGAPSHGQLGPVVTVIGTGNPEPTITYSPDSGFTGTDSFRIRVTDAAGATAETEVTVNVTPPNQAPVIDLDAGSDGLDYHVILALDTGGPVPAADAAGLTLEDDDATLAGATVTIVNLLDGEDESLAVDTGSSAITAEYGLGVLTLTGQGSLAAYEQVLRTVTYDNVALEPNTTPRLITFTVSDGERVSEAAITTVFLVDDWIEIELHPGWNLISVPGDTPSWLAPSDLFRDIDGVELTIGPAWVWDSVMRRYRAGHSGFAANQAFWAYSSVSTQEPVLTAPIPGRLRGGTVYLQPGWNLVGPVVDVAKADIGGIQGISAPIWYWDSNGRHYRAVPDDGMLLRGEGYWFYVHGTDEVELQFPE